jgi:5-methyltetrahydropteroyltriglutamate--homocysteine methyltransferase
MTVTRSAKPSTVAAGNLGFPRIGLARELKFALERYWAGDSPAGELGRVALELRQRHWRLQAEAGLRFIPSNDFSLYDHVLDTGVLVGAVPPRFGGGSDSTDLATYFAMARGTDDVPAMAMTKWFDTNYHYIVPELESADTIHVGSDKPLSEYREARAIGIDTRPVLLGPVSFVLLSRTTGDRAALVRRVAEVYREVLDGLASAGARWVQLDEPCLGLDLTREERDLFDIAYYRMANRSRQGAPKLFVATYFSDLRQHLPFALQLPIAALHLDLVRAPSQLTAALADAPSHLTLSLGVVNGRGVWRTDLDHALALVRRAVDRLGPERVQVAPSCSLLHVPVDVDIEKTLDPSLRNRVAFAKQKLEEVALLAHAATEDDATVRDRIAEQGRATEAWHVDPRSRNVDVRRRAASITAAMLARSSTFAERREVQAERTPLPLLPTTTIGSLPQTPALRRMRAAARKGHVTSEEYETFLRQEIERGIRFQEEAGLDVLVHGEFERTDMVEFFAARLNGFAFTEQGWVQSYGSRCVRPPLLYGDVSRPRPMTVRWSRFAQSLTSRPVKGMLTGPVTMLQWSFVREDLPAPVVAAQVALALRDEIADLEEAGIRMIQVDEPALREGLPLRADERAEYLTWAVDAFRLATGGAHDETQVHTHMCYADFGGILDAVVRMDTDVISLEAARSTMESLGAFGGARYVSGIGPGVYDVHSPRVPSTEEMTAGIQRTLESFAPEQLWINPDCGLKTRSWDEVREALPHMVAAAHQVREAIGVSA